MDTIRTQAARGKPFFLYLAYNAPHTPIQPPEEWFEKIRQREPAVSPERARYIALVEHTATWVKITTPCATAPQWDAPTAIQSPSTATRVPK